VGIKYYQHDVGSNPGDLETVDFKSLNPFSRIPVLVDGDATLCESNSIIRYLYAQHGTANSLGANHAQQAKVERWMDWELASLQPAFVDLFWRFYRTPEGNRDSHKIEASKVACENCFKQLNQHLSQQNYLAGDKFSMADICCATSLYRYFEMGIEVDKPKNLMDCYDRMTSRLAYRENIMVPFNELKGRQQF
jgi:glutathione S-transferase